MVLHATPHRPCVASRAPLRTRGSSRASGTSPIHWKRSPQQSRGARARARARRGARRLDRPARPAPSWWTRAESATTREAESAAQTDELERALREAEERAKELTDHAGEALRLYSTDLYDAGMAPLDSFLQCTLQQAVHSAALANAGGSGGRAMASGAAGGGRGLCRGVRGGGGSSGSFHRDWSGARPAVSKCPRSPQRALMFCAAKLSTSDLSCCRCRQNTTGALLTLSSARASLPKSTNERLTLALAEQIAEDDDRYVRAAALHALAGGDTAEVPRARAINTVLSSLVEKRWCPISGLAGFSQGASF